MKAIIFDFDGVIADTYKYVRELLKKIGLQVNEKDFKDHHNGNVYESPKIPFNDKYEKDYLINYPKEIHNVKSFFSLEHIKKLSKDFDLFIISSNGEKGIEKFVNHNKFNYFKEILGMKFHRSKVEKFKFILKKYNLTKKDCIFITDTLGDILEANKLNIKTIAVTFGYHDKKTLEKGNPYKIISDLNDLDDIIYN